MHKINEVLPAYKTRGSVTEWDKYKKLASVKDGELGQRLLRQCDAGLSNEDFDKVSKTQYFQVAIDAIMTVLEEKDRDEEIKRLRATALTQFLIKKLDGTIPWNAYAARTKCLMYPLAINPNCENRFNCSRVLSRICHSIVEAILIRHDLLTEDGGIFAERIINAIELDVPLARIKNFLGINFEVGIKALKKYIPDASEEVLAKCANEYQQSWVSVETTPKKASPNNEGECVKSCR